MVSVRRRVSSFLLVALLLGPATVAADGGECPRDRSRLSRNILNEMVLSVFRKYGASVPRDCPWAPERDIYRAHEEHKTWVSDYQWDCLFCGKAFYSQDFLDRHMRRKHDDQEYRGEDKVCLADYCNILRCDALQPGANIGYWERALCKDRDMSPLRSSCKRTVHGCLPTEHKNLEEIRSQLHENVCSYLTCTMRWKEPPNWGRLWNVTYLIVGLILGLGGLVLVMAVCLNQSAEKSEQGEYHGMTQRAWRAEPGLERNTRRRRYHSSPRHRQAY